MIYGMNMKVVALARQQIELIMVIFLINFI